jgi:tRNA dimethylallyltransferase
MGTTGLTRIRAGFIVGPTAAGKSSIAVQIAEQLGAEIVNADSRQVYRGMDIGTAKPGAEEQRRVPHHLIDIRDPDQPIDVAEFAAMARAVIADIARRGRPVLVVGGSGLYLRAIYGGIFSAPPASVQIRTKLNTLASQHGVRHLFDKLVKVDPEASSRISPNDLKRIVRALEVYQQTGLPISYHQKLHSFGDRGFEVLILGVTKPRPELYATIERRFDMMIRNGLIDEVRWLLAKGYQLPLSTIGYREIAAYIRGDSSLPEAIMRAKRASRRLAKRQLTWFRANPGVIWLDSAHGLGTALKLFQRFFSGQIGNSGCRAELVGAASFNGESEMTCLPIRHDNNESAPFGQR